MEHLRRLWHISKDRIPPDIWFNKFLRFAYAYIVETIFPHLSRFFGLFLRISIGSFLIILIRNTLAHSHCFDYPVVSNMFVMT